jgi:hypothetical protein
MEAGDSGQSAGQKNLCTKTKIHLTPTGRPNRKMVPLMRIADLKLLRGELDARARTECKLGPLSA